MFAFGSEIAVVPVDGTRSGNGISPMAALARDQLIKKIRDWVGVSCGIKITDLILLKFTLERCSCNSYWKGGENIRDLQDELGGMKLRILICRNARRRPRSC